MVTIGGRCPQHQGCAHRKAVPTSAARLHKSRSSTIHGASPPCFCCTSRFHEATVHGAPPPQHSSRGTAAVLHLAFLPSMVIDAALSKYTVSSSGLRGLAQPGGSKSISVNLFDINTFPAGSPRHLDAVASPFWALFLPLLRALHGSISALMCSLPGITGQSAGRCMTMLL